MNIYKDFKFTEDPQEQIAMGKEIAETYSEANIKQIKSYFDGVKDWEKKCPYSKEDMLYKSIMRIGCMACVLSSKSISIYWINLMR